MMEHFEELSATLAETSLTHDSLVDMDEFSRLLKFGFTLFSDIQIFSQHTDIVRHLVHIDSKRCCSAGDDGLVVVFDCEDGHLLHILRGHSRPITCLCPALQSTNHGGGGEGGGGEGGGGGLAEEKEWLLLTASSDRTVCMWNVETGALLKKFTDQNSTTKCIVPLPSDAGLFCFAGETLCLWSTDVGLIDMIPTDMLDDIQFLLVMKDDLLVAAADTHIVFYAYSQNEKKLSFLSRSELHRESIRSVVRLNETCFVSGSLDGAVLQWSIDSQDVVHQYNIVDDYQGLSRTYPYSIQHVRPLEQRYLLCAQGCGLVIYDTKFHREILKQTDLHEGKVLHLDLICNGSLLATCSEDSNIKLWRCVISSDASGKTSSERRLTKFSTCFDSYSEDGEEVKKLTLQLVQECMAHSAAVQMCLDVQPTRFLSCGVDHIVMLWKNSVVESCRCHKLVRDAIFRLDVLLTDDD